MDTKKVRLLRPVLIKWAFFVLCGVVAYGIGLVSGHKQRLQKSLIGYDSLSSHSNTALPKSPTK